jgi:hypothetical protein
LIVVLYWVLSFSVYVLCSGISFVVLIYVILSSLYIVLATDEPKQPNNNKQHQHPSLTYTQNRIVYCCCAIPKVR